LKLQMELKKHAHTNKILGMWVGAHNKALAKAVFSTWHEALVERKKELELEGMRQAEGAEGSMRMFCLLGTVVMKQLRKCDLSCHHKLKKTA